MSVLLKYSGNVSRGGKSSVYNVRKYNLGSSSKIKVYFRDRRGVRATYEYLQTIIGESHLDTMWDLARNGVGLNTYILKHKIQGERL